MLERGITKKDPSKYNLDRANINQYNLVYKFIEDWWMLTLNSPDYIMRTVIWGFFISFGGMRNEFDHIFG